MFCHLQVRFLGHSREQSSSALQAHLGLWQHSWLRVTWQSLGWRANWKVSIWFRRRLLSSSHTDAVCVFNCFSTQVRMLGLHNGCKFTACAHINASLPLLLRPQGMPSCRRSSGRFQQRGPSWFCCCASPLSFRSLCSTTPLVSQDSCCVEANLLDSYLLPFT